MKEFRCSFFARDYEASVSFYRDGLELPVLDSWDRGADDRGTLFAAASGIIEVLALPEQPRERSPWDHRPPGGVTIVLEVDDAEAWYQRATDSGLIVKAGLGDQPWGHRSFLLQDPDGLNLYFFSRLA